LKQMILFKNLFKLLCSGLFLIPYLLLLRSRLDSAAGPTVKVYRSILQGALQQGLLSLIQKEMIATSEPCYLNYLRLAHLSALSHGPASGWWQFVAIADEGLIRISLVARSSHR
jgi:hypothetical protein